MVSGIHSESWKVFPANKEGIPYIYTPIHLPTHPFIFISMHSPTLTHLSIHSSFYSFTQKFLLPSTPPPVSPLFTVHLFPLPFFPFTHPLIHPFFFLSTYSSIYSFFHSPTHSSTHPSNDLCLLLFICLPILSLSWARCMSKRRDEENNLRVWKPRLSVNTTLTSISLLSSEKMSRTCCLPSPTLMTISFCAGSEVRAELGELSLMGQREGPNPNCSRISHGSQDPITPSCSTHLGLGAGESGKKGPTLVPSIAPTALGPGPGLGN